MPPPNFRPCQFCGQSFGSASLKIHMSRCKSRPRDLPPGSQLDATSPRNPPPKPQQQPSPPWSATEAAPSGLGEYPAPGTRLFPCRHCGRTFAADRLPVHEMACRGANKRSEARQARLARRAQLRAAAEPTRPRGAAPMTPAPVVPQWRAEHEELQQIIRLNRDERRAAPTLPPPADQRRTRLRVPAYVSGSRAAMAEAVGCSPPPRRGPGSQPAASPRARTAAASLAASGLAMSSARGEAGADAGRAAAAAAAAKTAAAECGGGSRRLTAAQRHAQEWHAQQGGLRPAELASAGAAQPAPRPNAKPAAPWERPAAASSADTGALSRSFGGGAGLRGAMTEREACSSSAYGSFAQQGAASKGPSVFPSRNASRAGGASTGVSR